MADAKRSSWIYGACLVALVIAVALFVSRHQYQEESRQEAKVVSEEKLEAAPPADKSKSSGVTEHSSDKLANKQGAGPKSDRASVKAIQVAQPPSLKALREEVAKNPHETPQALLRFGADLGARMEEAKKDKASAIQLLSELKGCSQPETSEDSPVQARAICLVTAREIAQIWPDLKGSAEEIVSGSDERARELAAKISSFSR